MTTSPPKRRDSDVMNLMIADFEVDLIDVNNIVVEFHGPKDSPYEGGKWKVNVKLTDEYPYKPPSVEFVNKIYHPNIDEDSGKVCLNVLSYEWNCRFDLVNVFELFLPQLLLHPNPEDPTNLPAASQLICNKDAYDQTVRDYVEQYAKHAPHAVKKSSDDQGPDDHHHDGKSVDVQSIGKLD